MKNPLKMMAVLFTATILLSSCYSYTSVVGEGAQGNNETTSWNHYLIFGLAPAGVSDSKDMAKGAENYTVFTRQTFVNGLVAAITFGIYTPSTTTVTK
ncbi:Bor family protein [Bizionia sediminis]|uniref:Bor family protein n=1 Tax=Bizionia sediminis TaxID=1737064 RepID=A0ABW5KPQ7_9FLAO